MAFMRVDSKSTTREWLIYCLLSIHSMSAADCLSVLELLLQICWYRPFDLAGGRKTIFFILFALFHT